MYITLFDLLASRLGHLNRPGWKDLAPHNRALLIGLLIMAVLLSLSATAVMTHHHYVPLVILGVFFGGLVASVLGQFLAPKLQSYLTAFLGGITTGNIGSSETGLRKLISAVGGQINRVVAMLPQSVDDLSYPLTLSLWISLLTTLVILGANAYYANQESSPVGNPVAAPPLAAAAAAAAGSPAAVPDQPEGRRI
jgi:hypothetical protein